MKKKSTDINNKLLGIYESIRKLIEHELVEIQLHPARVILTISAYKAFMCDARGLFVDEQKARAFVDNLRFYINYTRAYASGLNASLIDDETLQGSAEDKWTYPPLKDSEYVDLYVLGNDGKKIIIVGKWNDDELLLKPVEENDKRQT